MAIDESKRRGQGEYDFRAIVEGIPAMIWTARPDGTLDYVSPRVCDFCDRTFDQMIEWGWADIVHPEDLPTVGEHWSRSLETGEPYGLTFRLRRASDGAYRRFFIQALPMRGRDGKIVKWHGVNVEVEDFGRDR